MTRRSGRNQGLGQVLVDKGQITEAQWLDALGKVYDMPVAPALAPGRTGPQFHPGAFPSVFFGATSWFRCWATPPAGTLPRTKAGHPVVAVNDPAAFQALDESDPHFEPGRLRGGARPPRRNPVGHSHGLRPHQGLGRAAGAEFGGTTAIWSSAKSRTPRTCWTTPARRPSSSWSTTSSPRPSRHGPATFTSSPTRTASKSDTGWTASSTTWSRHPSGPSRR